MTGKIGRDLTVDQGKEAARLAVLNGLAIARSELGTLDRIKRVVRMRSDTSPPEKDSFSNQRSSMAPQTFSRRTIRRSRPPCTGRGGRCRTSLELACRIGTHSNGAIAVRASWFERKLPASGTNVKQTVTTTGHHRIVTLT